MTTDVTGLEHDEWDIACKVSELMQAIGIEVNEDNRDTHKRIAKMLKRELFSNVNKGTQELDSRMTTFRNPQTSNQPIRINGIKFHSVCEHHWLPFFGECDIEYIPQDRILGLSKFPRVVSWFCKKPQVQERLTEEIGCYLADLLDPAYLKVTMRNVTHTCVLVRGVEAECTTDTVYKYGWRG